ncbi:hypothetical protein ABES58_20260 [Paenibacillus lautus]|uniref:hypothetical protein n=1 Tax=Paenibacillus lautus TaxID=1401 RepID=UPI003D2B8131
MTSHVQDFDLKKAPQRGGYAPMLIPNTLRGPQNKKPHKVEPMLRCLFQILCGDPKTYSEYIYGLRFAENFKKPPLPGGMLLYK